MKPPLVLLWKKQNWGSGEVTMEGWNGACIVNGIIYFDQGDSSYSSQPGYVWAWDSATGVTKSGYPLSTSYSADGIPCIKDNYIGIATLAPHISGTAGMLYVWDFSSLTLISGYPISVDSQTDITASSIIKNNRVYISNSDLYGIQNYYFYCYNVGDGTVNYYKNPLPAYGTSSTCAINKGKIVQNCYNTKEILCYNESDGSMAVGYPLLGVGGGLSSPIVYNDRIFIGSDKFYAVDINTATVPAPFPLTVTSNIDCTAAAGEGKVFFGTNAGYLYGIDANTGEYLPGFPIFLATGGIRGHIALANGVVYAGGYLIDTVFAVDANNGTILWQNALGGGQAGAYMSMSVAENKLVVSSGKSNGIFVFVEPSPTVTDTISPTYIPSEIPTTSPTRTSTQIQTNTFTQTPTNSMTVTPAVTFSNTNTPTMSNTPIISATQTFTILPTASHTPTLTATSTQTPMPAEFCFDLLSNYPNPFNKGTNIVFNLCKPSEVTVRIYTVSGELVKQITQSGTPGKNSIYWNTKNRRSDEIASGVFIYVIEARAGNDKAAKWGKLAVIK